MNSSVQLPPSISDFTPKQLGEVQELQHRNLTSITWPLFTTNHALFLIGLYLMSRICERIIKYLQPDVSLLHLKNCTTYLLEIFWTFVALALQLSVYRLLIRDFNYHDYETAQYMALILVDLYIFELLYRPVMRLPLIMHHCITIFLVIFGTYIIQECDNLDILPLAIIILFQATTEQITFVGLFLYRVKPSLSSRTLFFAAVQVFILKFSTLVWSYVFWEQHVLPNRDGQSLVKAFNVIFPICGIILFGTQIWSTYVVYKIAIKARRNSKDQKHTNNNPDEKKLEENSNITLQDINVNDASIRVTATS
ncbi:9500_t:CDS:2 [Ambispora leptoticha]|uniref:9500_t:CDS:1 n=1 Tax=Ambispora leptoticha TaxID=144679 RepID=A0A9N9ADH1_9GLOM|nr:9500_t:CDS:2 [Ambispora leptoticha]